MPVARHPHFLKLLGRCVAMVKKQHNEVIEETDTYKAVSGELFGCWDTNTISCSKVFQDEEGIELGFDE